MTIEIRPVIKQKQKKRERVKSIVSVLSGTSD